MCIYIYLVPLGSSLDTPEFRIIYIYTYAYLLLYYGSPKQGTPNVLEALLCYGVLLAPC